MKGLVLNTVKTFLDLEFFENCTKNKVTARSTQFHVGNKDLLSSATSQHCQQKLLKEELRNRGSLIRILKKEGSSMRK